MFAISWATRRLERIERLVLWSPYVHNPDVADRERFEAVISLAERDWELATETFAHWRLGWSKGRQARLRAEFIRESITQADFLRFWTAARDWDISALLSQVSAPTLLLQLPPPWDFDDHMRACASAMPNAQLVRLRLASPHSPRTRRRDAPGGGISSGGRRDGGREALPSGTAVILFADIADSTALTERLGDAAFREKARDLDAALRAAIRENGGTPVEGKLLGDGVLAVFTSAREAIAAALQVFRRGQPQGGCPYTWACTRGT